MNDANSTRRAVAVTHEPIEEWWIRYWRAPPPLLYLALFYSAYVLAGGFGQGLALIPGVAITFWPPAGIFVATLLMTSRYSWPWWIAAGCLAELTCNAIWFHNAIPFALIYFSANALVALTAAGLINRFIGKPFRLDTLEEVAAFVVLGAGIAPMISATIIATTDALLGKHPFWTAWPLVWLGDGTGLLVSTPLTLVAVQAWRDRTAIPLPRLIEAVVVLVILLGVGALSFKGYLPTPYILLPPLLWAAARFQLKGAAAALALIAIMAAMFAVHGAGGLGDQPGLVREEIVGLQAFLGISAISSLVVAVLSLQHSQALHLVKSANADLESRVIERTAALREIEAQHGAMFAASDVGMTQTDPASRRFLRVNTAMSAITGYSEAELLSLTVEDLNHPDDRAKDLEAWRHLGSEIGYAIEKRYLRKDGRTVWVEVTANLIRDAQGNPYRAAAVIHDITARKRAEEALRESEELNRSTLQALPAHIAVIDGAGLIISVNQAWSEFAANNGSENPSNSGVGGSYLDVCGRAAAENAEAAKALAGIGAVLAGTEQQFTMEYACHGPLQQRWFLMMVAPYQSGSQRGAVISHLNITERKCAEQALRGSEQRMRAIFDHQFQYSGLLTPEGKVVDMSESALRVIGAPREEVIGQDFVALPVFARAPETQELWRRQFADALSSGSSAQAEASYHTPDGSLRCALNIATALRDEHGTAKHLLVEGIDFTERKQAEEALQASEAFSRSVLEASPDCVKVIGMDGKLEFVNGNGLKQLEIDDFSFCRGELWTSLWPEETRQIIAQSIATAKDGMGSRFEAFCPTFKGTPKWWDVAVSPVLDAQQRCTRIVSVSRDISDRKLHEEHLKLMMNELNHRVKNTLATVQSMASQTLRSSPSLAEAKSRFESRLMSLSKAHDVLTREKWDSAPLADIVDHAIMPYRGSRQDRFEVSGPDIRISAQMALAFAMTLHELCTNAVKYGALSKDKGKVTITWSVPGRKNAKPILKFRWSEKGGPPVTPPTSIGFGTKLIERSLASDLGGSVKITFARTGVTCAITASLDNLGETVPKLRQMS